MDWTLADVEAQARAKLSAMAYDYAAGGAGEEQTLAENVAAYRRWRIRPRYLVDVSKRDLSVELLGRTHPVPFGVAPTAFHKLFHPDGEAGVARAAAARGILYCMSTLSTTPLEDACFGPRWFQLYIHRDRDLTRQLVERAERAGYEALALTIDSPVWGMRARDQRNRFTLPPPLTMANVARGLDAAAEDRDGLFRYVANQLDASLTWSDLDWLRSITRLPILVKGVLHPDDARLAVEHGAAGAIVSNHGARNLDRSVTTLDALPEIADAVDGRIPVVVDGGIRRGVDVAIALALGADFVMLGRQVVWGLAASGEAGVGRVLDLTRDEVDNVMALSGATRVRDLTPERLVHAG